MHWAMREALYRIQFAFNGFFANVPNRFAAVLLHAVIFPSGREFNVPDDVLSHDVVRTMMTPGPARDRLTTGVFVPKNENEAVGALEAALTAVIAADAVEAKIRDAVKAGRLETKPGNELHADALQAGVIDAREAQVIVRARELRRKVIMVDDFPRDLGKSEIFQTTEPVTAQGLRAALARR